jgi:hypothetical protein
VILFPKDTITIYKKVRSSSICGADAYGQPLTCNKKIGEVRGDLQPLSPVESRQVFGEVNTNTYRLYLNPNTKINQNDIIEIGGYTGFFKITGTPQAYNTLIPHIEVLLQHFDTQKIE